MAKLEEFSNKAQKIMVTAESIAFDLGHSVVGSEHLLLAFLKVRNNQLVSILNTQYKVEYQTILNDVTRLFGKKEIQPFYLKCSEELETIYRQAWQIQQGKNSKDKVSIDTLAYALLRRENSAVVFLSKYLTENDVKQILDILDGNVEKQLDKDISKENDISKKLLEKNIRYAVVLNSTKEKVRLERDDEVANMLVGLSCQKKANIALTGKPGVGKSALVEELTRYLKYENNIDNLKGYRVVMLQVNDCIADTKYRGEFEEKLSKYLNCIKGEKVITFIDEGHQIVRVGNSEGAVSLGEIIKPLLVTEDYKFIIATTDDEFRYIQQDGALMRRFREIHVDEPQLQNVKKMIDAQVKNLTKFHKISISDDDVEAVINESSNILNRFFPDKALDIIDYTMSYSKIMNKKDFDLDFARKYMNSFR